MSRPLRVPVVSGAESGLGGVAVRGRGVLVPDADAVVVADLHIGRGVTSNVTLPVGERADLCDRIEDLLGTFSPSTVVLAGDVLHAFGHVPDRARATLRAVETVVREAGAHPVAVAGNHDRRLGAVWTAPVHDEYRLSDGTLVCHGHEEPSVRADRYVVGHDHPAIEIEAQRRPCLLYGPGAYRGGDLVVLPAFSRLAPGVAVNGLGAAGFQSPLVTDADVLRPVVYDEAAGEPIAFPPLGEFRDLL